MMQMRAIRSTFCALQASAHLMYAEISAIAARPVTRTAQMLCKCLYKPFGRPATVRQFDGFCAASCQVVNDLGRLSATWIFQAALVSVRCNRLVECPCSLG